MGELILCELPIAATPYYIDSAGINIYSLEELGYLAANHPELLNEDLLSSDFTMWIGTELGLGDLKKELDDFLSDGTSLHVFIGRILRESGYLSDYEVKKSMDKISQLENKSEAEIRKIRADRLFNTGRFSDAVIEYTAILEDRKRLNISNPTEGNLFYNLGSSYARMFFLEEAKSCFRTAYEKTRKQSALRALLLTCLIMGDEEAFRKESELFLVTPDIIEEVRRSYSLAENSEDVVKLQVKIDGIYNDNPGDLMALCNIWKSEYEKNSGM